MTRNRVQRLGAPGRQSCCRTRPWGYSDPQYGFNNNVGSMANEGFIGIGVASLSPDWNPFALPLSKLRAMSC